jgi:hypothetical protein
METYPRVAVERAMGIELHPKFLTLTEGITNYSKSQLLPNVVKSLKVPRERQVGPDKALPFTRQVGLKRPTFRHSY